MIPSSIVLSPFSMGMTPEWCVGFWGLGLVVSWLSGPGSAESHEALTLAQELSHPFSLA